MRISTLDPARGVASLSPEIRRTFNPHWIYSVMGGLNAGILATAPTVGHKALGAASWHLALPTGLTGLGLIISLGLGVWMSRRPKMPFVLVPGALGCMAGLGMVATPNPLVFLLLLGICNLFETTTRPAITTIIRANYPVELRGRVTGTLRQWSAGAFILSSYLAARMLDFDGGWPMIRALIALSVAAQVVAYAAFATIRVQHEGEVGEPTSGDDQFARSREQLGILRRDRRFIIYLAGCFVNGVGALLYDPVVRPYFVTDLGMNYTQCTILVNVLPSIVSVLTVRRLGAWFDRVNPLIAWSVLRFGWGLDPLLLSLASFWPSSAVAFVAAGRTIRGSVMNGSWVLGWQLGTNYFVAGVI